MSDIHSNYFALEAVLKDAEKNRVKKFIILGDIFGYYPWANETYELLSNIRIVKAIKGNHDVLVLQNEPSFPIPNYWKMAKHNKTTLLATHPEALQWLKTLHLCERVVIEGNSCLLCHGTPDNPSDGRYYPDDETPYDWLVAHERFQLIMLGHTHYPLCKRGIRGRIIINPGSVGQPRHGIPLPCWGIFDFTQNSYETKQSYYDITKVVRILEDMQWDKRSVLALQKNYSGKLKYS